MVKCRRSTAQKLEETCLDLDLLSATRVTSVYLYRLSIVASIPILLLLGSFITLWLSWLKNRPWLVKRNNSLDKRDFKKKSIFIHIPQVMYWEEKIDLLARQVGQVSLNRHFTDWAGILKRMEDRFMNIDSSSRRFSN